MVPAHRLKVQRAETGDSVVAVSKEDAAAGVMFMVTIFEIMTIQ